MKNFKDSVPDNIIAKLSALSEAIVLRDLIGNSVESYGETRIDEIEGNYVSGWMPSQDGGFSVDEFFGNGTDEYITEKQKEFNWKQYQECFSQFVSDVINYEGDTELLYEDLTEEQKEQFNDYDREWLDPCLVQVQMFVDGFDNQSMFKTCNDKQVTIRLSVNYSDAPYYREKYAEDIKQVILEIDEFLSMDNEEIIAQLKG